MYSSNDKDLFFNNVWVMGKRNLGEMYLNCLIDTLAGTFKGGRILTLFPGHSNVYEMISDLFSQDELTACFSTFAHVGSYQVRLPQNHLQVHSGQLKTCSALPHETRSSAEKVAAQSEHAPQRY